MGDLITKTLDITAGAMIAVAVAVLGLASLAFAVGAPALLITALFLR